MGSNNNSNPQGRAQGQVQHQQQRYENQQGPMVNAFAQNYGRGSEANYGDYTDIMNQYRSIASGSGGSGGGGGGGASWSPVSINAETYDPSKIEWAGDISYKDPFNSYGGYEEFSKTGGYSADDMSNMRARGTSPIRAAYANAEREIGRQKSLQGGYSPNSVAARVKMAREQGQSMADASQNVEAGLAEARNRGRLAGLSGMQGIEGQRLGADLDVSKFNTTGRMDTSRYNADAMNQAGQYNAGARERTGRFNAENQMQAAASNAASSNAAAAASNADRFRALSGMTQLYGTTPGMSELFGNQLLQGVGQGGNFGLGLIGANNQTQQLPGAWDQGMGRAGDVMDLYGAASTAAYPWLKNNTGVAGGRPQQNPYENQPGGSDYDY